MLVLQRLSRDFDRPQNRSKGNGRRALNVIVEGQQLIAVTLEDGPGVRSRKVFPLETRRRELLLHRCHELIDEVKVRLTGHTLVPPAEIFRILDPFGIIGPDIQYDRQRPLRANSADQRVQRELANRDTQAAGALIANAEDSFAVRDDNHVDLRIGTISQQRRYRITQRVRDEQAARPPVNMAELLASEPNYRRVDYRSHFLDVVE